MKTTLMALMFALFLSIYGAALFAVLHPHVSAAYKAYYFEHITSELEIASYPGTPEKDMVFSRSGVPDWVQYTFGLSLPDGWGRWTDQDLDRIAGLVFSRSFSGSLCLIFTARAVPWAAGRNLIVRMGDQAQSLQVPGTDLTQYQVQFTNLPPTDRFELTIPDKVPRTIDIAAATGDPRRLGLNLATLRIVPGACPVV